MSAPGALAAVLLLIPISLPGLGPLGQLGVAGVAAPGERVMLALGTIWHDFTYVLASSIEPSHATLEKATCIWTGYCVVTMTKPAPMVGQERLLGFGPTCDPYCEALYLVAGDIPVAYYVSPTRVSRDICPSPPATDFCPGD